MSYILEALKKSEKKRQGEPSNLTHLATDETCERKRTQPRRPLWPALLGLALVLNAGVMLLIFWPSQSPPPDASAPDSPRQQAQAVNSGAARGGMTESMAQNTPAPESERMGKNSPRDEAQTPNASVDVPGVRINQRGEIQPRTQSSSEVATTPSTIETEKPVSADTVEEITQEATPGTIPPETEPDTRAPSADAIAEPAPVRFGELPSDYRGRLPEMHMSVHVYSEAPAGGLVRINNKMLRPGGQLEGGVRLEEITREGAMLSYAGRRFLLPRR